MAEATLNDISVQLKEQNKGTKGQTAVLQQIAKSVAGPSASQKAEKEQEKKPAAEGGGKVGGGGGLKGIGKIFKKLMGFVNMIKKGILLLLLPAILLFLNSPHFQKALSFIKDTLIPALKAVWEWLKLLFTDPVAALKQAWDAAMGGLATLGGWIYEYTLEPIVNWFKDTFGWLGPPIMGLWTTLKDAVTGAWDSIVEWFEGIWSWGTSDEDNTWSLSLFIDTAWGKVKEWFTKLWDWGKATGTDKDGVWSLTTFIDEIWAKVKKWFTDLWAWGKKDGEGPFKLSTFIDTAIEKVWGWVKSLFAWAKANEKESWVAKLITDMVTLVKGWVTSIFSWASTENKDDGFLTKLVKDAIKLIKEWVTGLFSWASTAGVGPDGEKWSLTTMIDAAVNKVIEWAKSLFTWATEPVDEKDSFLKKMVHIAVDKVIEWAKSLFTWANTDEVTDPAGFSIVGTIKKVIKTVIGWVTGLFSWVAKTGEVDGKEWSLFKVIDTAVDNIIEWVTGLFTWAAATGEDAEGEFSIFTLIGKMVGKAWTWLKTTVLGWFGIKTEDEEITGTVDEGTRPEKGWLATLFGKIFPKWLTSPVAWAMEKLGLTDASGTLTDKGSVLSENLKAGAGIGSLISDLFGKIFPEWITSPIVWIKGKLGLTGDDAAKKDTWKFPGFPSINDIKEFLPKFITDPIGWVKGFFSGGGSEEITKKEEEIQANRGVLDVLDKKLKLMSKDSKGREALVKQINELATLDSNLGYQLEDLLTAQGKAKGGQVMPTALSIVGEKGPEFFIPQSRGTIIPNDVSQVASMLSMGAGGGGGGGSTTNVSINAPTNSNTTAVSNTTENVMGASDPYVGVAGAYG